MTREQLLKDLSDLGAAAKAGYITVEQARDLYYDTMAAYSNTSTSVVPAPFPQMSHTTGPTMPPPNTGQQQPSIGMAPTVQKVAPTQQPPGRRMRIYTVHQTNLSFVLREHMLYRQAINGLPAGAEIVNVMIQDGVVHLKVLHPSFAPVPEGAPLPRFVMDFIKAEVPEPEPRRENRGYEFL